MHLKNVVVYTVCSLSTSFFPHLLKYCIAGKIRGVCSLAVWQLGKKMPNSNIKPWNPQVYTHYWIAKFKINQIIKHSVLAEIAKFNAQMFPLYGTLQLIIIKFLSEYKSHWSHTLHPKWFQNNRISKKIGNANIHV